MARLLCQAKNWILILVLLCLVFENLVTYSKVQIGKKLVEEGYNKNFKTRDMALLLILINKFKVGQYRPPLSEQLCAKLIYKVLR